MNESVDNEPILCYVDGPWAYFTTKPLNEQWGDDWDDAPYEHNAEPPYEPCWHRQKYDCQCDICKRDYHEDGTPKWRIIKVAWEGPYDDPATGVLNSSYSVQDINNGATPWLTPWYAVAPIWAGTTLEEFKNALAMGGGRIYE